MTARIMLPGLLAMLLLTTGCSRRESPSEEIAYDSELARQTLIAALDAWRQGQTWGLARQVPPIRFHDDDQMAGWRLTDYQLPDASTPLAPFGEVLVTLRLQRHGATVEKTVAYQVSLTPQRAVFRGDS